MVFGLANAVEDSKSEVSYEIMSVSDRMDGLISPSSHKRTHTSIEMLRDILYKHGVEVDKSFDSTSIDKGSQDIQNMLVNEGKDIKNKTVKRFVDIQDLAQIISKDNINKNLVACIIGLDVMVEFGDYLVENLISYVIYQLIRPNIDVYRNIVNNGGEGETEEIKIGVEHEYQWSYVTADKHMGPKYIFVKFDDILVMNLFQKILNDTELFDKTTKIKVKVNHIVDSKVWPMIEKKFRIEGLDLESFKTNLNSKIEEVEQLVHHVHDENDDIDEYTKMYNEYYIDPKDIAHISDDLTEQVKKSIIEFRLHALKVAKERKDKQLLKERQEMESKFQRSINVDQEGDQILTDDKIDLTEDWEHELKRAKLVRDEEDESMKDEFAEYQKREDSRTQMHIKYLNEIKHDIYVNQYVPKARTQFMNKFVYNVKDFNNSIDKNFNYYTVHANYVKFREKKKREEEAKDAENRKAHENNNESQEG